MSFKLLTRLTVVLTATMLVAGATAVSAATPTESSPNRSAEAVDQLLQKANEQARVPVIVTLNATPSRGVHATDKKDRDKVAKSRDALLREIGPADALKTSDEMPVVAFHATADQLKKLRRSSNVVDVVEDREVEVPNDVMGTSSNGAASGQQIADRWDDTRVRADVARANGWNGTGQVVAVIDSGVDRTNPYLAGDVVAEACYSTNAIGYTAGGCPNGRNVQTGTGAAAPCVYTALCAWHPCRPHRRRCLRRGSRRQGHRRADLPLERGEDHLLGERPSVRDELRLQPPHHISDRGGQHEHWRLQLLRLLRQRR